MKIDVFRIAGLAHLRFSEQELAEMEVDMQELAEMVSMLPDDTDVCSKADRGVMELRSDEPDSRGLTVEDVLRNTPNMQAGCFTVPKTVQ